MGGAWRLQVCLGRSEGNTPEVLLTSEGAAEKNGRFQLVKVPPSGREEAEAAAASCRPSLDVDVGETQRGDESDRTQFADWGQRLSDEQRRLQ